MHRVVRACKTVRVDFHFKFDIMLDAGFLLIFVQLISCAVEHKTPRVAERDRCEGNAFKSREKRNLIHGNGAFHLIASQWHHIPSHYD